MKTREQFLGSLSDRSRPWDVIVIGGGATGLGTAVDAASRGYRTLLLEQRDFAGGTSSRSTKLVHGGVRYLQQGDVSLVREALRERTILLRNAPHLVHELPFVIPVYDWWEAPFFGLGLKIYDLLGGRHGFAPSRRLSRDDTIDLIPTVNRQGLLGGVMYHDGQFDDARLAVDLAKTLVNLEGTLLNYLQVRGFIKEMGQVTGVVAEDVETGTAYEAMGRAIINATGVFSDAVRQLDDPGTTPFLTISQGIHLVLDRSFLPGASALMVPHTADGRVLFAIPWHDRVVVGTTDTPVDKATLEPVPLAHEIDFLLAHAARYLDRRPKTTDVLSMFAGLRPLAGAGNTKKTADLSRSHRIIIADSGLISITGGKWTTYRKMGEEVVDAAAARAGLQHRSSGTTQLRIHGWQMKPAGDPEWNYYGSDAAGLAELAAARPALQERLHTRLPSTICEVIWAVRHEWARTVEDVLARRTRSLFLDAGASMEAAPKVARLMAEELHKDEAWEESQVKRYRAMACKFLPSV